MPSIPAERVVRLLQETTLFRDLRDEALSALAAETVARRYAADDLIIGKGERAGWMLLVVGGRVKVVTTSERGHEIVLGILHRSAVFREMTLLDGTHSSGDVIAVNDAQVLMLRRDRFLECVAQHPDTAIQLMEILCERNRLTTGLLEETAFKEVPARLFSRIESLAGEYGERSDDGTHIRHGLSQELLGRSIGCARESVNKQLREWQDAGLVEVGRGYLLVRDLDSLRERAANGKVRTH